MFKRIFTPLLSIAIIAAVIYGYFQFRAKNTPVSNVFSAVPENAFVIIETKDAAFFWEKFAQSSVLWEELKHYPQILQIHQIGNHIDSVLKSNDDLKNLLGSKHTILAIVPNGATAFQSLLAINLPPEWDVNQVNKEIKAFIELSTIKEVKVFNNSPIYTSANGNSKLFWTANKGVLLVAESQLLLEDAILSLDADKNVLINSSFKKINATAGTNAVGNVYINYSQFGNFIRQHTNKIAGELPISKQNLGKWSSMDVSLKSNKIILNGFVDTSSDTDYLGIFKNQSPQEMQMLQILPVNTACLLYFGLSDFVEYRSTYKQWLRTIGAYAQYEEKCDSLNNQIDGDIEDKCLSWIDGELAIISTETKKENLESPKFLVFKSKNRDDALLKLTSLSNALGFQPTTSITNNNDILEIELHNSFGILLGQPFDGFYRCSAMVVNDYIVISNSASALLSFSISVQKDKTLGKNTHFNAFIENLGSKSNLMLYSNIARSPDVFKQYLKPDNATLIDEHLESIRNFEGFTYQIVNTPGEMLYNNIVLSHNPIYEEAEEEQLPVALWRCELEANAISDPQLVTNHYTNTKEIVIQDANHTIYLVSNTGKILWKKTLDGPILGDVEQIDVYKNGKLQMLFNTSSTVYLLDRNGKKVERFPIKLPKPSTSPLGLFDYDKDKEYRILVPCSDNKMRMYNAFGEEIKGWNSPKIAEQITNKPQHIRVGTKDYIFACESTGVIHLLDRQGKLRHKVKSKAENRSNNPLFIQTGKDIKSTKLLYTDTLGNIVHLGFDDEIVKNKIFDGGAHYFNLANINDDQRLEVIIGLSDQIICTDQNGNTLCTNAISGVNSIPSVYTLENKKTAIGFSIESEQTIYLLDDQCNVLPDFPQAGQSAFKIDDINKDGTLNLVVLSEKNILATYNLK